MLVRDGLPELDLDLIATLTAQDVDVLAHGFQAKETSLDSALVQRHFTNKTETLIEEQRLSSFEEYLEECVSLQSVK